MVTLSALSGGAEAAFAPSLLDAIGSGVSPAAFLADIAEALPGPLRGADATPSVPTGASDIPRDEALTYLALARAPRLVEPLGPDVGGFVVGDDAFALSAVYDDPASGFNALQLRSLTDDRSVFALNDNDFGSLPDVVADLNLARPQIASPAFAAMVKDATAAALTDGRDVVFTGASLGGALVQVGAYETAEAILAASPGYADRVTAFGVDPLGGRDATEDLNDGVLDPVVLERINALHVRTEGDIVSRTGSQLGNTLSFEAVDSAGNPASLSAAEAHVNLVSLFTTVSSDALFAAGTPGDPGEISGLTLLANLFGSELSEALSDPVLVGLFGRSGPRGLPANGSFDPTGGFFDFDANADGVVDL
ncbi:MAG: hypothetical protein ICV73_25765, partial [Acetobacteraceae bacterium]|nr:hypothetical protein [Acetobacteraceae bacterium]